MLGHPVDVPKKEFLGQNMNFWNSSYDLPVIYRFKFAAHELGVEQGSPYDVNGSFFTNLTGWLDGLVQVVDEHMSTLDISLLLLTSFHYFQCVSAKDKNS